MSIISILVIILAIGIIVGGITLLKKSAKKFNLTTKQLDMIKQRNEEQDKKDKDF